MNYRHHEAIFLTGATGVLGARILQEILLHTPCRVLCLMRDANEEEAWQRLKAALRYYTDESPRLDRIEIIRGDICEDHLGVEASVYDRLTQSIGTIIHAAASVNFTGLYATLQRINVHGTEEVARLALNADVPMIHVSSYSLIGDAIFRPDFTFQEEDCDVGQDFKGFSYGRTKLEAELALRDMGHLRWNIVRPGDIYGDSRSGAYPLHAQGRPAFFYDILKTAVETGYAPFREDLFDITPVDVVARAIVVLALQETSFGMTYHIMNPRPRRFFELMNHLIDEGYRIRMLPFDEYVDLFRRGLRMKDGRNYSSEFTAMTSLFARHFFQKSRARFGSGNCAELFTRHGLRFPEDDQALLARYVAYCQKAQYFAPPDVAMIRGLGRTE